MQRGYDGDLGMKARACCSTVALSKATTPMEDLVKNKASSAWLGEKMSTFSITFLWCSNVSGEQVLA